MSEKILEIFLAKEFLLIIVGSHDINYNVQKQYISMFSFYFSFCPRFVLLLFKALPLTSVYLRASSETDRVFCPV